MAERIDVFISSTSRDLKEYRAKVKEAVLSLNMFPIAMEEFQAGRDNALQRCFDKVQEAEVFVGIYAHRYGFAPGNDMTYTLPDGSERTGDGETSITHLEYQWAIERDIPVLLYVLDEDVPWSPKGMEDEPGRSRLKAFKSHVQGKHIVGFFTSPDDLASQVKSALADTKINLQTASIAKPVNMRCDFYKHVQLPPNYVPRKELLDELRLALLGDETVAFTSAIKGATALHGMGGIGKSVMARALCEDETVQAAFPDGILWTALGQEPILAAKLREWVDALGGVISESAPTVDTLKTKLAELLENRACLLIVDDVWQKKHAEAFRVGGDKCRLLLTTRDAEVARSLGADIQPIPTMTQAEAIELLREWAGGGLTNTDPHQLRTIVTKLGRLPLAIKLAGAQLQLKSPEKWLERFNARKLASKRPEDVHDSLEQTFGLSLETLEETERKLYAALAIFREDEPIREVAIGRLWSAMGNLDDEEAEELLDDLAARALLEVVGHEFPRAALLHDLLRDFMAAELEDARAAHQTLIDAYAETRTGDGWHTAPDDGYLYEHLAYHLHSVDAHDALYHLLTDAPDWMNTKFAELAGDQSYVADLELAIDHYTENTPEQVRRLAVLWAARQVVNGRVDTYDDSMLKAMVLVDKHIEKTGRRTREALNFARLRTDVKDQFRGLCVIYTALDDWADDHIEELLKTVKLMNSYYRASSLRDLAGSLARTDANRAKSIFELAIETSKQIENPSDKTNSFMSIARAISKAFPEDAKRVIDVTIQAAEQLEDTSSQADAFHQIGSTMIDSKDERAEQILEQAYAIAEQLEDVTARAITMSRIVNTLAKIEPEKVQKSFNPLVSMLPNIKEPDDHIAVLLNIVEILLKTDLVEAEKLFIQALDTTKQITRASYRGIALSDIAVSVVEHALFERVLDEVEQIDDSFWKDVTFNWIVKDLSEKCMFSQAIDALPRIKDEGRHLDSLERIVDKMGETDAEQTNTLIEQAWQLIQTVSELGNNLEALSQMAGHLAKRNDVRAVQVIQKILANAQEQRTQGHVWLLCDIAVALSRMNDPRKTSVIDMALTKLNQGQDQQSRVYNLIRIAKTLFDIEDMRASDVFNQARQAANQLEKIEDRSGAQSYVASQLADANDLQQALEVVDTIERKDSKVSAIGNMIASLIKANSSQLTMLIDYALELESDIESVDKHADLLCNIADAMLQINDDRMQTTLDRISQLLSEVESVDEQSRLLRRIANVMLQNNDNRAETLLDRIFARSSEVNDKWLIMDVASTLAKANRVDQALMSIAHNINSGTWWHSLSLGYIAEALTEIGQFDEAMVIIQQIEKPEDRKSGLQRVALKLADKKQFDEALAVAHQIVNNERYEVLTEILPSFAKAEHDQTKAIISQVIESLPSASGYDFQKRSQSVGSALAYSGKFGGAEGAFAYYGVANVRQYISSLIEWVDAFEKLQQRLSAEILLDVWRVVEWQAG